MSTMTITSTAPVASELSSTTTTPETASWQEASYRCPRPGFFLGDDGSLASTRLLHADPDTSASASSQTTLHPSWSVGTLKKLPLELLHQIAAELGEMDMCALVTLRNCNRGTAAVVDSLRDFHTVASFPRALGALVKMAPPSLSALAACLRTTACASCGDDDDDDATYGDYIYLLRPERVCYTCFRSKPEYLPVARLAGAGRTLAPGTAPGTVPGTATATSIRVPPGRYGVLAHLTQPVDLVDRRQVEAAGAAVAAGGRPCPAITPPPQTKTTSQRRPDPLRYAAVIPGPYWRPSEHSSLKVEDGELDSGFACRACCQTDRSLSSSSSSSSAGPQAGWANPLARYTARGLAQHVADPQYGGRVVVRRRRDPRATTGGGGAGAVLFFEHDAPRRVRFPPPPAEYGATADLARRYEAIVVVPEGSAVG